MDVDMDVCGVQRVRVLSSDELNWIQYTFDLENALDRLRDDEPEDEPDLEMCDKEERFGVWAMSPMSGMERKRPIINCSAASVFSDSSELLGSPGSMRGATDWLSPRTLENSLDKMDFENRNGSQGNAFPSSPEKRRRTLGGEKKLSNRKSAEGFTEGRWTKEELALLIHVTADCIEHDIKIICDIVTSAGLNRPRRAVDKQLKRMLKYDKWASRDRSTLLRKIKDLYEAEKVKPLKQNVLDTVEECKADVLVQRRQ